MRRDPTDNLEVLLSTSSVRRAARPLAAALLAATAALGSTLVIHAQDAEGPLTIYSGRADTLVAPILERFTEATGIPVDVRYGDTAELAALLLEEGDRSPADVFFAQDAGALGAVSDAGLFATLAPEVLDRVEA